MTNLLEVARPAHESSRMGNALQLARQSLQTLNKVRIKRELPVMLSKRTKGRIDIHVHELFYSFCTHIQYKKNSKKRGNKLVI
jgi:hypothetical protein